MKWANLKIRQQVLLVCLTAAGLPLIMINVLWLRSSQAQLKEAAASQQSLLVTTSADKISEFVESELNGAIAYSQVQSLIDLNIIDARLNLLQYAYLDENAVRIALVDKAGDEKIVIQDNQLNTELKNIKESDAFNVVRYRSNEASIGKVYYVNGDPRITISVPLLSNSKLGAQTLTSAQAILLRTGSDTKGALLVDISLNKLWQSVVTTKLGQDGYSYIVDGEGELLAHRDKKFLAAHQNIIGTAEVESASTTIRAAVQGNNIVHTPQPRITNSETGVPVLSSHSPIASTGWAVIAGEPISGVYRSVNQAKQLSNVILAAGLFLASVLIYLATNSIIKPLRQLTIEATSMGEGNFNKQIEIRGDNELSSLGRTFNKMSTNLQNILKRYQEQNAVLLAEQAKLQAVLNTITNGVIALDEQFEIALVNNTAAKLVGNTAAETLLHKPWSEVFNLSYKGSSFDNSMLDTQASYFKDVGLKYQDQTKYLDLATVKLPVISNGIAYILTIQDITESRELETMRLDFVSMAAHELRTPLTSIIGYLGLLSGELGQNALYIEHAKASAQNLATLINNMLSLSRIERNALKFNTAKIDWLELIATETTNLHFAAEARHQALTTTLPEGKIFVSGDKLALAEVISNFVNNAIHYTGEGGKIDVMVAVVDSKVRTTVTDNGIGIPPESLSKLFTKYYRVAGGLTTNSQGTGIGLFISKTIVEAHNGTIGVRSQPGHGSSFYFDLPLYDDANPGQTEVANDTMGARSNKIVWFK